MGKKTGLNVEGEGLLGRSEEDLERALGGTEEEELEGDEDEEQPSGKEILNRLSQLDEGIKSEAGVAKLLQIPGVIEAVRTYQSGGTLPSSNQPARKKDEEAHEEEIDLNELDNKGLVREMMKMLDGTVSKKLDQQNQELNKKLEALNGYVQHQQQKTFEQQVAESRAKHPDFETYRPSMIQIADSNPNLPVEELYALAKLRAGGKFDEKESGTRSERPTEVPRRTGRTRKTDRSLPRGRRGFDQLLADTEIDLGQDD